ncbi:formamidopyrimidine-DNA glycosylase [Actinoalloteichus hoggarensis]|uniref:Putative formamidopyrimidine-DNA glycosylase-like protein n=1 Tax=Actinoalloteichus hoggarensis TaxID=1470176 RepID=A0A221VW68_9PSEU|nr:DNA-formamidopyrimidine glycosylase family protein [Actinoalloteichus hoggarensis]ASO17748.1 putative formamidopyrimidine-DNA glycosylase-like protein [Actinoalloteichus hoggarensis]MBB5922875.1 formamidopyrimidine-DNA glycosylase [Actinoalloteichus hoggarensis]
MPELPEIEAIVGYLREHAVERTISRIDIASPSVLKTADPPWTELHGGRVRHVDRHGKFLDLDCGGLHLVTHLARAGWLRWADVLAAAPPRPGRGPLAVRVHLGPPGTGPGFDLTEAGTRKGLAVWVVRSPSEVPGIANLGPDAATLDEAGLAEVLRGRAERLKTVLTTQSMLAGLGNAYSDEVLHAARLSPYATAGRLTSGEVDRLHAALEIVLSDAVHRSVGLEAARLKGEKRSGLRVHGRTGLPCPVCGDTIAEVSFADRSFQYCPTCQTGGRMLADRRRSRFVK